MKKLAIALLLALTVVALPRGASATYGKNCTFHPTPFEILNDVYVAGGNGAVSTAVTVAISYAQAPYFDGINSWAGLGVNTTNLAYPIPALGTAWLLGAIGRGDNWAGFHPASQYGGLQMRDGSAFHNPVGWAYLDDTLHTAKTNYVVSPAADVISFECPDFSQDVIAMAAIFMHENWHAVLHDHGFAQGTNGHMAGPLGQCNNGTCDYFYAHHLADYLPTDSNSNGFLGYLSTTNYTHYYHTPFQMETEWACDVANYPQSWTPATVWQNTTGFANDNFANIANVVPWKCGLPVPF